MRTQLTDRAMLEAAQQRLAEHMATRPARGDEAAIIRQSYLASADEMDRRAARIVYRPATAAEIGRGPDAPAAQHDEAIHHSHTLQRAHAMRSAAAKQRLHAAAWTCDGSDMADQWETTRREMQQRVDYYQQLVSANPLTESAQ